MRRHCYFLAISHDGADEITDSVCRSLELVVEDDGGVVEDDSSVVRIVVDVVVVSVVVVVVVAVGSYRQHL